MACFLLGWPKSSVDYSCIRATSAVVNWTSQHTFLTPCGRQQNIICCRFVGKFPAAPGRKFRWYPVVFCSLLTSVFDWLNDWRNGWPHNWMIELATQRMSGWMTNASKIRLGERSLLFSSLATSASQLFSELLLLWATSLSYLLFEVCLLWTISLAGCGLPLFYATSFIVSFFGAPPLLWSTYSLEFFPQRHLPSGATSFLWATLLWAFFSRALWAASFPSQLWASLSYSEPSNSQSQLLLAPCGSTSTAFSNHQLHSRKVRGLHQDYPWLRSSNRLANTSSVPHTSN